MSNELEKKIDPKYQGMIDTVRKTIFPGSDDAELALFFHRCTVAGCNPLDQLIHPMKFNDAESGGKKVVFITSINLLRSKSDETGTYDGMDEPEYEGEDTIQITKDGNMENLTVPTLCRVKVYRKGIDRPFVGVARWKEYYPEDKKGHQWRIRPYHMLAKCAEALARRQAWPEKLNQLYTAEEMENATAQIAGVSTPRSTKPAVNPDDVRPRQQEAEPSESAIVQNVTSKSGTGKKGPWTMYSVEINDKKYSTFDKATGELAKSLKGQRVSFTFKQDGQYLNLESIAKAQPAPQNPTKPPETAQGDKIGSPGVPVVESAESFASTLMLFAAQKGLDEAKITAILQAEFDCTIDTVPAELQGKVLEHIKAL